MVRYTSLDLVTLGQEILLTENKNTWSYPSVFSVVSSHFSDTEKGLTCTVFTSPFFLILQSLKLSGRLYWNKGFITWDIKKPPKKKHAHKNKRLKETGLPEHQSAPGSSWTVPLLFSLCGLVYPTPPPGGLWPGSPVEGDGWWSKMFTETSEGTLCIIKSVFECLHFWVLSTPRLLSPAFLPSVPQISRCLSASSAQPLPLDCSVCRSLSGFDHITVTRRRHHTCNGLTRFPIIMSLQPSFNP